MLTVAVGNKSDVDDNSKSANYFEKIAHPWEIHIFHKGVCIQTGWLMDLRASSTGKCWHFSVSV